MADDEKLNPLAWDRTWSQIPDREILNVGLDRSQTQSRENWVVKLEFTNDGSKSVGTGFFINVPGAKAHVILTAAHNLFDNESKKFPDLVVKRRGNEPIKPEGLEIHKCPDYDPARRTYDPEHDYGVIIVPKETNEEEGGIGFGFALSLATEDLSQKTLELTGYYPQSDEREREKSTTKKKAPNEVGAVVASLETYSGECLGSYPGYLEYDIGTIQGLSGSPVWMPYKGHETVVAVQYAYSPSPTPNMILARENRQMTVGPSNNAPDDSSKRRSRRGHKKGRTGARLNATTLKQILTSAGVVKKRQALMAEVKQGSNTDPLYLHFLPDEDCAWIHWGQEKLNTSFDVFPAYSPTPVVKRTPLYAFQYVPPQEAWGLPGAPQWVLWDVKRHRVTLTSSLQPMCLAWLKPAFKKFPPDKEGLFTLAFGRGEDKEGSILELRMDPDAVSAFDREEGTLDGTGIWFGNHVKNKQVKYNFFRLVTLH
ncbi:hypothetical protein BJX68DRAFT_263030 [Aspergillus pseudodeflectus]|uniref:Serine protease n=1 Tax=Aspergillus pseudodeflectus TaxID=176178 RepID=A0ABR4KYZ0_9EURO